MLKITNDFLLHRKQIDYKQEPLSAILKMSHCHLSFIYLLSFLGFQVTLWRHL